MSHQAASPCIFSIFSGSCLHVTEQMVVDVPVQLFRQFRTAQLIRHSGLVIIFGEYFTCRQKI